MIRASSTLLLLAALTAPVMAGAPDTPPVLPEFPKSAANLWLNSKPLEARSLRGQPVLVEFWAFGCSNCLATQPWMKEIASRYRPEGLVVIGVHTPEFPREAEPLEFRAAVARLGIAYPVMLDPDYAFWRAERNSYWPAFYLYGRDGHLIAMQIGELHLGQPRSDQFVAAIEASLREPRPGT